VLLERIRAERQSASEPRRRKERQKMRRLGGGGVDLPALPLRRRA